MKLSEMLNSNGKGNGKMALEKLEQKVRVWTRNGCLGYDFYVVGEKGAIVFTFRVLNSSEFCDNFYKEFYPYYPMGIEMHERTQDTEEDPSRYMGLHKNCWVLGNGDSCYHDGSSLQAQETLMPGFLKGGTEWLWPYLEQRYFQRWCENGV